MLEDIDQITKFNTETARTVLPETATKLFGRRRVSQQTRANNISLEIPDTSKFSKLIELH